jgi:hypothetical protein
MLSKNLCVCCSVECNLRRIFFWNILLFSILSIGIIMVYVNLNQYCENLYQKFDDCKSRKCYHNSECKISEYPKTDEICIYEGYVYYPSKSVGNPPPCPTKYYNPYWLLLVLCVIIFVDILVGIYFVSSKYIYRYIPISFRKYSHNLNCAKCGEYSTFITTYKVCGKCFGVGKIYETKKYLSTEQKVNKKKDVIVGSISSIKIFEVYEDSNDRNEDTDTTPLTKTSKYKLDCKACNGEGKVIIYDTSCPFCGYDR